MRSVYLFLSDILENIELIENSTRATSKENFCSDRDMVDATIRRLEIIGEAVKNVPESFRERHKEVPWKDVAGLRDVVIHGYFRVDLETVWRIVKEDIPTLKQKIKKIKDLVGKQEENKL